MKNLHAHLVVSSEAQGIAFAQQFIQKILCSQKGCGSCWACKAIVERQHHSLLWIAPEKNYTRDLLEPLFTKLSFSRDPGQPYFFVLQSADFLSPAVGNSLLKSLEEPPAGYNFILLASSKERVMPTILSRCVIHELDTVDGPSEFESFIQFFTVADFSAFARFQKELTEVCKNERDAVKLLDQIYTQWAQKLTDALRAKDEGATLKAQRACEIIQHALSRPVMPGSAKLVFRDLFMQLCSIG